jgi:hypothetical protein
MAKTITHKASGWTRERTEGISGRWRVTPTDGTGPRIVAFMSGHSWANLPNDSMSKMHEERVVLVSGEPLPEWAQTWLEGANLRECERAREQFRRMVLDAELAEDQRHNDW